MHSCMRASFLHSLRRVHTDILHNGCTIMPFGNAWSHISFFTIIKWVVSSLQMGVKTKNQAQLALNDIFVIARTVLLSSKCSNLIAFLMEDLDFIHKNDTRRCVHKDTILSQGLLLYRFFLHANALYFMMMMCVIQREHQLWSKRLILVRLKYASWEKTNPSWPLLWHFELNIS